MRKLIIVVASLMVLVLFIFQGFQQIFPVPETTPDTESTEYTGEGITTALDEIYYHVSIMGVEDATAERLASDFGIDTSCFSAVYGRYTNGRFGIADVIIVIPTPGEEAAARDALVTIRSGRSNLFRNFNIYGASDLADSGVIYTHGDYLILLMIEDAEGVRETLDEYLPS